MNSITGQMPLSVFMASLLFASFGWLIHKYVTAQKRDKKSKRTPTEWNWKFWIRDNWFEALMHMIIMFCIVRFSPDIITYFWADSKPFFTHADPMLPALVIGYMKSWIINKVRKGVVK